MESYVYNNFSYGNSQFDQHQSPSIACMGSDGVSHRSTIKRDNLVYGIAGRGGGMKKDKVGILVEYTVAFVLGVVGYLILR